MGYGIAAIVIAQLFILRLCFLLDDRDPALEAYELEAQADYLNVWNLTHKK